MASKRLKEASKLLQIGWPLVFTFASDFSFATVAIVSSGWISSAAVASVGLTLNLLFFTITFFFVSLSAITVITAELNGSGARESIGPLMRSGFFLASVFCLLAAAFILTLWYCLPFILPSSESSHLAQDFLSIGAWIIPLEFFAFVIVFTSNGLGKTFWVGVINFACVPILILLTWIIAFGNLGVEAWGVNGVALSILITVAVRSLAFLLLLLQREFADIKFFGRATERGVNDPMRILKIGIPLGFTEVSNLGFLAAISLLVSQLGVVALAAHSIATNIYTLAHMFIVGLSRATVIVIGEQIGAKASEDHVSSLLKTSLALAAIFSIVVCVVLVLQSVSIASLYSGDIDVISLVASLLVLLAFLRIIDDLSLLLQASLEGFQNTRAIFFVRFSSQWFIGLLAGWLLSQWYGVFGYWLGIGMALVCSVCGFALVLSKELAKLRLANSSLANK